MKNRTLVSREIFIILALILHMSWLLAGCKYGEYPDGTIATVNGEPISLRSLQILMDSRSASLGIPARPSIEDMQKNYGHALSVLIVHALVRQELQRLNMEITEKDIDETAAMVKDDFGLEKLDQYLQEASLREDDWRALTRDYLALEKFKNSILLPGIKVGADEIRDYYRKRETDFNLPDNLRACFLASEEREDLESWCLNIGKPAPLTSVIAQCVDMTIDEIPPPWDREIKKIKEPACGSIANSDGEWRTVAILQREKGRSVGISESYALIENILLEQKQNEAFDAWLRQKLSRSRVLVSPHLKKSLVLAGENGE